MNKTIKILMTAVIILVLSNIVILYFMFANRPYSDRVTSLRNDRRWFHRQNVTPEFRDQMGQYRQRLMRMNWPAINKIRKYDQLIYQELLKEQPDENKINLYVDSTHIMSKQMRAKTINYFLENKDSLTQDQKQYLLQNFLRKHVHKQDHRFRNTRKGRRK